MNHRGLLSLILLSYEIIRSAALVAALVPLSAGVGAAPYVAMATPNALFAIMAVFLFADEDRYGVFLHLYLSGKAIFISALLVWSISSFQAILSFPVLADSGTADPIVLFALLLPADILSFVVAVKLGGVGRRRAHGDEAPHESAVGRIDAGDTLLGGR